MTSKDCSLEDVSTAPQRVPLKALCFAGNIH